MEKAQTAREVAAGLFAAEAALDDAIREFARLTARMVDAREELGLSCAVGPEAFARIVAVQTALAVARSEGAELHAALGGLKERVGLRGVAVGGGDKEDPPHHHKPRAEGANLHALNLR